MDSCTAKLSNPDTSSLYIVIPAYNEEMNIEKVVEEWHQIVVSVGSDSRLVVFDDGSKDQTFSKLKELEKQYPQLLAVSKTNSGHGATLLFAYEYALSAGADYIFQTDSDGQTLSSEFYDFWENRLLHPAIIGYRQHRQDGWSRVFVTKVLKLVLRIIFRIQVTDANTPYRLFQRQILERYLPLIPENFNLSNVLLTVLLLDQGEDVLFLPITFRPRQGGTNSINLRRIFKIGRQAVKDFRQIKRSIKKNH